MSIVRAGQEASTGSSSNEIAETNMLVEEIKRIVNGHRCHPGQDGAHASKSIVHECANHRPISTEAWGAVNTEV
jgi:hypothetical protein